MSLVQGSAGDDDFVDGACGDKDKPRDTGGPGLNHQPQRTEEVLPAIDNEVPFRPAKPRPRPIERRMHNGVDALNDRLARLGIVQLAGQPLDTARSVFVKPAPIAPRAVPRTNAVAAVKQMVHDVSPEKSGCTRYRDTHCPILVVLLADPMGNYSSFRARKPVSYGISGRR